jgi:hypothetical protein
VRNILLTPERSSLCGITVHQADGPPNTEKS